jgi:SAM-dependent methyltransferase
MSLPARLIKATVELSAMILLILDLVVFKKGFFAAAALAFFLVDFIRYRREALLNFQKSKELREGLTLRDIQAIETEYSLRDDFNSFEKHALVRRPLDRFFFFEKYQRIRSLLHTFGSKGGLWLDFGCGFGEDTFYIGRHLSQKVVGLELDEIKLLTARKKLQGQPSDPAVMFLVGDALHPPFQPQKFDMILMTEVLEHLLTPEAGIQNCHYLLKEGGGLILSTPSRHNLDYSMNPFRILEKALALVYDRVLPPYHGLHAQFEYNWKKPERAYGIHYHFSQKALRKLVTQNRFTILWEGSFEIEVVLFLYLELLFKGDMEKITALVQPIESLLEKIPGINQFGQHLLLVAQKNRTA